MEYIAEDEFEESDLSDMEVCFLIDQTCKAFSQQRTHVVRTQN